MNMTTAITGKQCTFEYGTKAGEAQITNSTIDQTAASETIQTLGGSVAVSQGIESEVGCEFLYDGDAVGGFYAALQAALDAGTAGTLTINAGGTSEWSGEALVTALGAELPADGAVTCSATFTISGALGWTDAVVP
jgi:hypothetical protein